MEFVVVPSSNGSVVRKIGDQMTASAAAAGASWWGQRRSEFPGSLCGEHVQRGESGRRRKSNRKRTPQGSRQAHRVATKAATSRWWWRGRAPPPESEGETAAARESLRPTPRLSAADHAPPGPPRSLLPFSPPRARPRPGTTGASQWAAALHATRAGRQPAAAVHTWPRGARRPHAHVTPEIRSGKCNHDPPAQRTHRQAQDDRAVRAHRRRRVVWMPGWWWRKIHPPHHATAAARRAAAPAFKIIPPIH